MTNGTKKKLLIAVVGHGVHADHRHVKIAEQIGKDIAKAGAILLCGGRAQGIMDAASKSASEAGGVVVGILPESDSSLVSKYVTIPILTGIGYARNQIIAFSCDAMIVIGGGVGTLTEVAYAYHEKKPIVHVKGSGGAIESYIGKYMDEKKKIKIVQAAPTDAVALAIKLVKGSKQYRKIF